MVGPMIDFVKCHCSYFMKQSTEKSKPFLLLSWPDVPNVKRTTGEVLNTFRETKIHVLPSSSGNYDQS